METLYHYHCGLYIYNVKFIRFSMIEYFTNYMQNVVEKHPYSILKDLVDCLGFMAYQPL